MKLVHFLKTYTQISSKWIKDLNERVEAIKLLEENIGKILFDRSQGNISFELYPKAEETKIKMWGLIKLKSFCTAKETTDKMKREPIGENIFSNGMTDNELISNIYKQIIQLNLKKKKIKNLVKKLSRTA